MFSNYSRIQNVTRNSVLVSYVTITDEKALLLIYVKRVYMIFIHLLRLTRFLGFCKLKNSCKHKIQEMSGLKFLSKVAYSS